MTYQQRKAVRILNHAIDTLGKTKPCPLMVIDGKMLLIPHSSPADEARTILARAMVSVVREEPA